MLEFVNLSGPEAGKDQQTRRKVRSQAMRDFRRRQRAENDKKRAVVPQSNRVRTYAPASHHAPVPHSQFRPVRPQADLKRVWSEASITQPYALPTSSDFSGMTQALQSSESYTQQTTSAMYQPAYDAFVSSSTVSPTWSEIDGSFDSQEHINSMLEYCKSYLEWLCPDVDPTLAAEVLALRQEIQSCPTILAALCLASVGHLDAVRGSQTTLDHSLYKARVFRNITDRMNSSATAVSDETVGYMACLLSYEMSNCNPQSKMHLQGLQSIIRLKGGLNTFNPSLTMMLECLDLCHALIFDQDPVLISDNCPRQDKDNVEYHLDNCTALFRLLRNETDDFYHSTPASNPYRQRLVHTPRLLQDVMDVVDILGPIPDFWKTVNIPVEVRAPYEQRLEQARAMGIEQDPMTPDAHYLARAVHLRILLMYHLDVLRLHPNHPQNQNTIDGLWYTMRKISESAWTPLPYLRLWILLAGATLSRSTSKKGFFKAHLVRCVFRMGLPEWHRVKTFMVRFLSSRRLYMTFMMRPTSLDMEEPAQLRETIPQPSLPWNESRISLDEYSLPMTMPDLRSASVPLEEMPHIGLPHRIPVRSQRASTMSVAATMAPELDALTLDEAAIGLAMYDWQ